MESKKVVLEDGTVGELIAIVPQNLGALHGLKVVVKTRDENGNVIQVEGVVKEEL